jgi:DNA polymerase elongation subunit (family B)|tara:strand:+ start:949 stop:3471 length:2523 start_codon:yes stop_codon:yes gene_type:complete
MHFYTNVQNHGNKILVREYKDGQRQKLRLDYSPSLFHETRERNTKYKSLDGKTLKKVTFPSISAARGKLKESEGMTAWYGMNQFIYPFISDYYPDDMEYDLDLINVANIDIEVECEKGFPQPSEAIERVNAITLKTGALYTVLGLGDWENKNPALEHLEIKYYKCTSEMELLRSFLNLWEAADIDIVTGWNVNSFDMLYLVNRIEKLLGEEQMKRLSPFRSVKKVQKNLRGMLVEQVQLSGLVIADYLDLYKKFTYVTQESYRLDHIAQVELGKRKLDHSEFSAMHLFYKQDYQKYIDYNIIDVELVDKLDDKLKLIELLITIAYQARVNYDEVMSPIRTWDSIAFNLLKKDDIVVPPKTFNQKTEAYAGGYVKEPHVGIHDWVLSFDLNSLYPHLIMQYNISPETLIETDRVDTSVDDLLEKKTDTEACQNFGYSLTPNGVLYDNKKRGFLPKLMQGMYDERVISKKEMLKCKQELIDGGDPVHLNKRIAQLNNKQMAAKILLNSAYGALGNQYFRYFDIRQAESITLSGQLSIRWIEKRVNEYMNRTLKNTEDKEYVIASDTDSIYVVFSDLVSKVFGEEDYLAGNIPTDKVVSFLDRVAQDKLEPFINKSYEDLASYMNSYEQKMVMAREVIASKGLWTAKKRYILNVHDNEGVRYKTPELKIMGIEAVRSSTPAACRDRLKQSFKVIMKGDNDELIAYVENFREEFKKMDVDMIAFPRSVNGLKKYKDAVHIFKKGTPIHVKGVIHYNILVEKHNLGMTYPVIQEGEKIKFVYLKEPNPLGNNTIAISSVLPEEFDLHRFIDHNKQFEKAFLDPIKTITDTIGWQLEKRFTIDDFF